MVNFKYSHWKNMKLLKLGYFYFDGSESVLRKFGTGRNESRLSSWSLLKA